MIVETPPSLVDTSCSLIASGVGDSLVAMNCKNLLAVEFLLLWSDYLSSHHDALRSCLNQFQCGHTWDYGTIPRATAAARPLPSIIPPAAINAIFRALNS